MFDYCIYLLYSTNMDSRISQYICIYVNYITVYFAKSYFNLNFADV